MVRGLTIGTKSDTGQQPRPTKGLSRKAKGHEQHLQLQAHYQQSLMDNMQDRVHEEVSAALSPWAGAQQHQHIDTQQQQHTRAQPTTMQRVHPVIQHPKVEQMEVQGGACSQGQKVPSVDGMDGLDAVGQMLQMTGTGGSSGGSGSGHGSGGDALDRMGDVKPAGAPMEEEEPVNKLETRRDRNREHARKCRLRKKLLVVSQQQRLAELEHTNRALVQALYRVAPADHVNAILASAVQGGMVAAMTPMSAPQLPISQRQKHTRGAPAAQTLLDEEDVTKRGLGSSECVDSMPVSSGTGGGTADAGSVGGTPPGAQTRKVQVQAAHLGAELAMLDKLKRSLQAREEKAVETERGLKKRAADMLAAEKSYALDLDQMAFAQQQQQAASSAAAAEQRSVRNGVSAEAKSVVENPNAAMRTGVRAEAKLPDQHNMHQVPSMQWDLNADDAFEAVDDLMQFLDANPDGAIGATEAGHCSALDGTIEAAEAGHCSALDGTIEVTEAGHCSIPRVPSTQWNLI
jgi:hypothetical protein